MYPIRPAYQPSPVESLIALFYGQIGNFRFGTCAADVDALLAQELEADLLVIATDVDGVYLNWGTPDQQKVGAVTPDELSGLDLPKGSMGPKVDAACQFARATGKEAVIGSLADIDEIVQGTAGTRVKVAR